MTPLLRFCPLHILLLLAKSSCWQMRRTPKRSRNACGLPTIWFSKPNGDACLAPRARATIGSSARGGASASMDSSRPDAVLFFSALQSLTSALHNLVCARSPRAADNGSSSSQRHGHNGLLTNPTPDYCCTERESPEDCCSQRSSFMTPPSELDPSTSIAQ